MEKKTNVVNLAERKSEIRTRKDDEGKREIKSAFKEFERFTIARKRHNLHLVESKPKTKTDETTEEGTT